MPSLVTNSRYALDLGAPPVRRAQPKRAIDTTVTDNWRAWLDQHFAAYVSAGFAPRHEALWAWFAALEPGVKPLAKIAIWPRGGAKSSTAELGACYVGMRQTRRFVLYVSKTQAQADKHLQSIAAMFEALRVDRAVNKYNQSKGWTQQILRTANGFNVVSLGLDAAGRGIKLDQYRPDLMILDDVDDKHDSAAVVEKKIETLTESVLPSEAPDCAILFVQNLIHKDSIAAQLADGRADFLLDREPVSIEPAAHDLSYTREIQSDGTARYRVTGGMATWSGQSLDVIQQQMNSWGRRAFEREAQHRVKDVENGLWQRARDIDPFRVTQAPDLRRVVVAVDPSATSGGDEAGIVVAGIDVRGHGYVLDDRSLQGSPRAWATAAAAAYHLHKADRLVAESNNGGEMVEVTISTIPAAPPVTLIHASRGKITRAEPVQKLYEDGRVHHVGVFDRLEDELCSFVAGDDSPNRMDALVWSLTELMLDGGPLTLHRGPRVASRWEGQ